MKTLTTTQKKNALHFEGSLSYGTAMQANLEVENLFDVGEIDVFDFGGLEHYDSSCLACMIEWQRHAQQRKHSLRYRNIPKPLRAIAKAYNLSDYLLL